jgi:hypothetical protein
MVGFYDFFAIGAGLGGAHCPDVLEAAAVVVGAAQWIGWLGLACFF